MIVIALVSTGLFFYLIIYLLFGETGTSQDYFQMRLQRIADMGKEKEEKQRQAIGARILRAGFVKVVMLVGRFLPIRDQERNRIMNRITRSGLSWRIEEFLSVQLLTVVGGSLGGIYLGAMYGNAMLGLALGLYGGFAGFRFFMGYRETTRSEAIERQIPEVLDLLCVSVEAGLSFNQSLQYVTEQCSGVLIDEFAQAQRTISMGKSRRVALEQLSDRCGLDEIKTFVGAVIQADEMGIGLKGILKTQAQEIRVARKMKIQEKAQKIPVKMLLPMVIFILPVLFVVILGPAVPRLLQALG